MSDRELLQRCVEAAWTLADHVKQQRREGKRATPFDGGCYHTGGGAEECPLCKFWAVMWEARQRLGGDGE